MTARDSRYPLYVDELEHLVESLEERLKRALEALDEEQAENRQLRDAIKRAVPGGVEYAELAVAAHEPIRERWQSVARERGRVGVFGLGILDVVARRLETQRGTARLGPTETLLLLALVDDIGNVVRYDELALRVWGHERPCRSLISTNKSRLRARLAELGLAERVVTINAVGMRLEASS